MKISFVVRGIVTPNTRRCLESIRENFPNDEIILSTWKHCHTDDLTYDTLIKSDDPGAIYDNGLHLNRQIVASQEGLKAASCEHIFCLRADMEFKHNGITKAPFQLLKNKDFSLFDGHLIISSIATVNPFGPLNLPYHISEKYQFGYGRSVKEFWNIPLVEENGPKLRPEQYVLLFNMAKKGKNINLKFDQDNTIEYSEDTMNWIFSNFRTVDDYKNGIECLKYPNISPYANYMINQEMWNAIYGSLLI